MKEKQIELDSLDDGRYYYFENHYRCRCGYQWVDNWSCQCDDECAECGSDISPHYSNEFPVSPDSLLTHMENAFGNSEIQTREEMIQFFHDYRSRIGL